MKLNHKTRSIAKHIKHLRPGDGYLLGIPGSAHEEALQALGFSSPFATGERLLPGAEHGPACQRNAEGAVVVHRDQPMETAYRQVEWHWKEFRGRYDTEDCSRIVDVPYQRYPRTQVAPYGVELEIRIAKGNDDVFVVAGPFSASGADDERATNTVNVFIELFGECTVLRPDMTSLTKTPVKQLNWELLPPGKNPWKAAQPALERVVRKAEEGNQPVIRARFETVGKYDPDFVAIGNGGFDGYVVFGFPRLGICVLECRSVNNATYVLNEDSWETVSMLSKAEILDAKLHRMRLVHREGWFDEMESLLRRQPPHRSAAA